MLELGGWSIVNFKVFKFYMCVEGGGTSSKVARRWEMVCKRSPVREWNCKCRELVTLVREL